MGDVYDGAFRTILNDCQKLIIPIIPFYIFSHEKNFAAYNSNEQKLKELKAEYQKILEKLDELEQQEVIGAFDKWTIIDLSGDVIKEIAQKYENVQKGIGDMMRGTLIETEARSAGMQFSSCRRSRILSVNLKNNSWRGLVCVLFQ